MNDPTRILFGDGDEDDPEPAPARTPAPPAPARDAKLNDLGRAQISDDDGLPRRRHPRPEPKTEPNKPLRPDRHGARIIEDYLRRNDRTDRDEVVEADLRRAHTARPREDDEPDPDWIGVQPLFRDEAAVRDADAPDESDPAPDADAASEADSASRPARRLFRDEVPMRNGASDADSAFEAVRPLFRDEAPTRIQPPAGFEPADDGVLAAVTPDSGATADVPDAALVPESASARPRPPRASPMKSVVLSSEPEPEPEGDTDPPTLIGPPVDLSVPDFVVPGFTAPAPKPPLRTVLSTVLGPELWQRCYSEWGPAHCVSLARVARSMDGLAPSAAAALRATADASMRWFGASRERDELADLVAGAISHPAGASDANRARTTRLYGAAICVALNIPLRRCACHHDLERDVSSDLIRLGLAELAGEVL